MSETSLPHRERESWWVAILGPEDAAIGARRPPDVVLPPSSGARALRLFGEPRERLPATATDGVRGVVWRGILHDRTELRRGLEPPSRIPADDAELILTAYRRFGAQCLEAIKGTFAVILWDSAKDVLVCARDPLGLHPVFFAEARGNWAISDSIDALLRVPGVSPLPSRVSVAMHLASLPLRRERTFFDAVERIPPGHAMRLEAGRRSVFRYWDPAPPGKAVDWVRPDEIQQFEVLFDQAVARCQSQGRSGIFLSGGLDSASIAAVAVDNSRRSGASAPIALSLLFPDPECDEETIQRAMARSLGLEHLALPFADALGPAGLLQTALDISSRLPAPLDNFWLPAYYTLTQEGKRRGCERILTGTGGDEWLSVTPLLAADLIPSLDVSGLYRLWKVLEASYKIPRAAMTRNLLWTNGVRPLLGGTAASILSSWAPGL
ncbi:MAG: asparagine synthase-related protein, partial [Candidatus Binatia bacterium]